MAAASGSNWRQYHKNGVTFTTNGKKTLKAVNGKWVPVSSKDLPKPKAGSSSKKMVKPSHRNFLTMIHETSAEHIGAIQRSGIRPGCETHAQGYSASSAGNSHIFAYHHAKYAGTHSHAAVFSTATWEQDPASEGVRLRGTAVPARDASSNTQTICITSIDRPLTPSTKRGMNIFYRAAIGYETDDNSAAQYLLNQFHDQFSGSSVPRSAEEVMSVDPFAQFENQDMQGPVW